MSEEFELVVALVASAAGLQISKLIRLPSPVALVIVGIVIGPAFLNIVRVNPIIEFLSGVGIVLLLFQVGLESDINTLKSKKAVIVGSFGIILPWLFGFAAMLALNYSFWESFFIGVLLTATSVGITVAILSELKVLEKEYSRVIVGAAVVDDVLGLIALSIATAIELNHEITLQNLLRIFLVAGGSVVVALFFGIKFLSLMRRYSKFKIEEGAAYLIVVSVALLASYLSEFVGLSPIVGSFIAGLVMVESGYMREMRQIEEKIHSLVALFAPLFFLHLGLLLTFDDLVGGLALGILLTVAATLGKYLGCYVASRISGLNAEDSKIVGVGMVPRGEVALIAAQIGLVSGIISSQVFSAAVLMSFLTSVFPPLLLYRLIAEKNRRTPVT